MRALVLEKKGELSLREIALPLDVGPDDVKIAIHTVGVCGSDVHYYTHGAIGSYDVRAPMVLGHEAVGRVVERCFLQSVLRQSIDTLSKGYKHRTCLAQALIHDPDVLIMDEPTDGLDPNQKHEVRNLIRELGRNKAIVFSTHILEEVDAACTRAIIIDRGRIVANGTPEELRAMSDLAGAVTLSAHGASAEKLSALGRVEDLNGAFRIYPRDKSRAAELAQDVVELVSREGWKVEGMFSERGELDEVFRRITLPDTVKR